MRKVMKAVKFSQDEIELLEKLKGDRTYTQTIVDGLRCLEASQGELTDEFLVYTLRRRLKERGKDTDKAS